MSTSSDSIEDDRIVAKCYLELGNVTKEKGEYDESLRYHRKSMEIYERIDDPLSVADSHLNIAEIYKAKGELKEAMSEYEKGLTLYEDVYVEDVNKNSDSGTDVSLNSSSFSDLQHTKALSKSDETLPQTTLTDIIEQDIRVPFPQHSVNGMINTSTSSLNPFVSPTIKISEFDDVPQLMTSMDDSFLMATEKLINERTKSLSSSSIPDLVSTNADDMLLPLLLADLPYKTTPGESGILDLGASLLPPLESVNENPVLSMMDPLLLDTKLEDTNLVPNDQENTVLNNKKPTDGISRLWYSLPNKQLLVIILSIFLTGVLFWSLHDTSIKSLLSRSSNDFVEHEKSDTDNNDDLAEQLRKFVTWRKDRVSSLNKDNRRIIEEFLASSDSQTTMTVDTFQRILDMLDLKIVLIPQ